MKYIIQTYTMLLGWVSNIIVKWFSYFQDSILVIECPIKFLIGNKIVVFFNQIGFFLFKLNTFPILINIQTTIMALGVTTSN